MKKIMNFMKSEKLILSLIFILMFVIYFYYFNNIISIDTEHFIINKNELLNSWIGINRFSLVFIKNIINIPFNILITRIFTFILFYISIIIYTYLFSKWINNKEKLIKFIIAILISTTPIFAEQFGFTLQSAEIAFGLLLFGINFILLENYFNGKNKINLLISIIMTTFCFGLYQAFVPLYIAISIFYLLTHENKKIKELIIMFFISFAIYYLIGYVVKNYIYQVNSTYLSNSFNWKNISLLKNILRIGYFGVTTLLGITKFHSISYLVFLIIGTITLIKNRNIKDLLLYFVMAITPFLLIITTASNTAYRAQFSYIFVLIFMFLYLIKMLKNKKIIYIIIILPIIKQCIFTPTFLYNDYKRFSQDIKIADYISEIIETENKCIIFVGKYNNEIKFKGETLGNSFAAWDYDSNIGVNVRMHGFLQTQNINYRIPSEIEYQNAKQIVLYNKNDIIYEDGCIIVNLDNIKMETK